MMRTCPETGLPIGDALPALEFPHFPARHQAVIWRNWGVITAGRLGQVLKTDADRIEQSARELGLGHGASAARETLWLQRGYLTIIRQNWHLLSYSQLIALLGWTPDQMAYALKEEDFLWNKLGRMKPTVSPVLWEPLTSDQIHRTKLLRDMLVSVLGEVHDPSAEPPFGFLQRYGCCAQNACTAKGAGQGGLRLMYSYSAVYGDPLLDSRLDPYPDGLLADYAANGVNAIWLQGVLYTLVPWLGDGPHSEGHTVRVRNLNTLIARATAHGIRVYLYLNEPRGMPESFFASKPDWQGGYYPNTFQYAMCVSVPDVQDRLRDGVTALFRVVPDLAGVFTITMSENITHCHSKGVLPDPCPRCADRSPGELAAIVNNIILEGARAVRPDADVIAWSWGWGIEQGMEAINRMHKELRVMCTSESRLPTKTRGIEGFVGDYSISKIGPGPVAAVLWRRAAERGMGLVAKVQVNNTWECAAVPYLPVPFLVDAHLRELKDVGINDYMASWTLGGYPGGNLRLMDVTPQTMALENFGERAATVVLEAWKIFGEAFIEFPVHGAAALYYAPQNCGPMNLLFAAPSGRSASMVAGFPYDDLERWRGNHFPPAIFEDQFQRISEGWAQGLERLREAGPLVCESGKERFNDLLNTAECAYAHFRSTFLQIRFIRLRDGERSLEALRRMHAVLEEEIELAAALLHGMRRDSRIGYEAGNHYFYTETALMEKILNCAYIRNQLVDLTNILSFRAKSRNLGLQ